MVDDRVKKNLNYTQIAVDFSKKLIEKVKLIEAQENSKNNNRSMFSDATKRSLGVEEIRENEEER